MSCEKQENEFQYILIIQLTPLSSMSYVFFTTIHLLQLIYLELLKLSLKELFEAKYLQVKTNLCKQLLKLIPEEPNSEYCKCLTSMPCVQSQSYISSAFAVVLNLALHVNSNQM